MMGEAVPFSTPSISTGVPDEKDIVGVDAVINLPEICYERSSSRLVINMNDAHHLLALFEAVISEA